MKVLFLLVFPLFVSSQTMKSIVRQLPRECTPDLNNRQKETLLKNAFFEFSDADSLETIRYTLDTPVLKNYISFGFDFTTGQSGFGNFELKRFKTVKGSDIIIFSKFGGARWMYTQDTLKVFFVSNGKIIAYKEQTLLPQSIDVSEFLKKQTPDSIRRVIENSSNTYYSLNSEKPNQIEFNLSIPFMPEELEKWLLGDSFIFTWNGKSFNRKLAFQIDSD